MKPVDLESFDFESQKKAQLQPFTVIFWFSAIPM